MDSRQLDKQNLGLARTLREAVPAFKHNTDLGQRFRVTGELLAALRGRPAQAVSNSDTVGEL